MAYSNNPQLPRVRREAAALVSKGWSARKVGRYLGFHHTAVLKWVKRAEKIGLHPIPTRSSRPKHHPKQLSNEMVWNIFHKRLVSKRCAEVVHQELVNEGKTVSLSSVKRTLERTGLLNKRSPYKRYHPHQERPIPLQPGALVEMDTIHLMISEKKRIYVYTLIDVYSRWVYAKSYARIGGRASLKFVAEAQRHASFTFHMLQSDHGPEFGDWFVEQAKKNHRYTRIGKPNDNAHIERFNRTLQEECLDGITTTVVHLNRALKKYIPHYNTKRLHLGINLKTPQEMVPSY